MPSKPFEDFRTWVKNIGEVDFRNASRHFGVIRCNRRDAVLRVEICPTARLSSVDPERV